MSYKKMLPLVLAALLLWTIPASAAPETTLKVAVGDPEDSEMGVVGHAFKKYVEEKTGGKVEVQCFYGGSLGDESEAFRNVQKGTLPLAMGGIANLVPFEKKLGLLTLPYLFANIDEVVAGTNGAPAELLNKYATKAGFRILTWTYTDFRYISNSKRPITKMADMQGLKFRVPQSAVLIAAYKAFGGSPTPHLLGRNLHRPPAGRRGRPVLRLHRLQGHEVQRSQPEIPHRSPLHLSAAASGHQRTRV